MDLPAQDMEVVCRCCAVHDLPVIFCRNCLANWYMEAANEKGIEMDKMQAREIVYGMPFDEWKAKYQNEATPEQKAAFAQSHKDH